MENVEIELQMSVEFIEPLVKFLEKEGRFEYETHQIDEYFNPPHKDFTAAEPLKEWLRLRNSDGKCSINYKDWHYEADGKTSYYCDEYESKIDNLEQVRKIFESLNFKSLTIVDKTRKIYMYKDFEISLDNVKGLGNFVELEFKGNTTNADPKKIGEEMVNLLKKIGCGKLRIQYQGYPFLLLFPDRKYHSEEL